MPDVALLLQNLHPMREPPPPEPVAPFLLTAALGIAAAAAGALVWWRLRRRRAGSRRTALEALAATRGLAPAERLAAQATLLRRLVRVEADDGTARAQGEGWLAALDRTFTTTFFTAGPGRAFGDGLYRRGGAGEVEAIHDALALLIGGGTGRRRTRRRA